MAAPALLALPALAKALGFAKGLAGAKAATSVLVGGKLAPGLAAKASGLASGQVARTALTRMAGPKLAAYGSNFGAMMPKTAGEWGMRVAPDAIFGVMAGAMTPGDMGDKLIAGTTATVGGAAGGLAGRGLIGGLNPKLMKNPIVDISTEMLGGMSGDIAAQGVADGMLRAKGGGMTPYEKMAAEQQRELEQQILRQYLSGKGGYPSADPTLVNNGLG